MGVALEQRNGLEKDELALQLYGFVGGYIPSLAPLELSDIRQINQLDLLYYLYFVRYSNYWLENMKSSHPNPQRDGYNLEGFPDQNRKTQNNNDQISARNHGVYI